MFNSRLRHLLSYVRPYWKTLFLGIFALFIVNGLGVWIPILIRDSIDDLRAGFTGETLQQYVWGIFISSVSDVGNSGCFPSPNLWDRATG